MRSRKLSQMSMAREEAVQEGNKTDAWSVILIDRRERERFEVVKRVMLNISGDPASVQRGKGLSTADGHFPEDKVLGVWIGEYIHKAAMIRRFTESNWFTGTITLVCFMAAVIVSLRDQGMGGEGRGGMGMGSDGSG